MEPARTLLPEAYAVADNRWSERFMGAWAVAFSVIVTATIFGVSESHLFPSVTLPIFAGISAFLVARTSVRSGIVRAMFMSALVGYVTCMLSALCFDGLEMFLRALPAGLVVGTIPGVAFWLLFLPVFGARKQFADPRFLDGRMRLAIFTGAYTIILGVVAFALLGAELGAACALALGFLCLADGIRREVRMRRWLRDVEDGAIADLEIIPATGLALELLRDMPRVAEEGCARVVRERMPGGPYRTGTQRLVLLVGTPTAFTS